MTEQRAPNFIDFSQYSSWMTCPWKWAERYINRIQRVWPSDKQRDDNMAVGSLVHDGLQNWYENGIPEVTPKVLEEIGPTPEAFALVNALLQGFVRAYPCELWTLERCEEPVRAPLIPPAFTVRWKCCPDSVISGSGSFCLTCGRKDEGEIATIGGVDMLAKIDSYFKVLVDTPINSGVDGFPIVLAPGYWIQEFKTKAMGIDRGKWMQTWATNMQASFQILCLEHKLRGEDLPVRGLLVSVLEKPKPYVPKRVCKVCDESYELASWLPAPGATLTETLKSGKTKVLSEHISACPVCGNLQQQKPYEPKKAPPAPSYFRIAITRTEEHLAAARERIEETARQMERVRGGGVRVIALANTLNCVSTFWGPCEYFTEHTYDVSTLDNPKFESIRDYVGETPLISIEM